MNPANHRRHILENNKKKKRFRPFDIAREGRGIGKNSASSEPGFKRFFITLWDNFGKIVSVNILFVLGNFPAFFAVAALAGVTQVPRALPLSDLFQNLFGTFGTSGVTTPYTMTVFALEGLQHQTLAPTTATYVFYGIGALALLTFGVVNAGTAYILRNLVSGEPVFVWSDFLYAIKRNYKQALPFGIVDGLVCVILCYNIYSMLTGTSAFFASMLFWANVVIFLVWFFMRYYIYLQMVTFRLTVFKIIKNSLIFSLVGIKRNLLALLGILLCLGLEVLFVFSFGGVLLPFGVAAPLALLFSLFAYMKIYAAYFKVKELMIDPYLAEHPEEAPDAPDVEVLMHDDVTERERLEEIKRRQNDN